MAKKRLNKPGKKFAKVLRESDPELYERHKDKLDDPMMRTTVRLMMQNRKIQKQAKRLVQR